MSSSLIITLELGGVLGVVVGLGVWELLRLRRDRTRSHDAEKSPEDVSR